MILISSQNTMTLQEFTSNLRQRGKEKNSKGKYKLLKVDNMFGIYSTKDTNGEIERPIA